MCSLSTSVPSQRPPLVFPPLADSSSTYLSDPKMCNKYYTNYACGCVHFTDIIYCPKESIKGPPCSDTQIEKSDRIISQAEDQYHGCSKLRVPHGKQKYFKNYNCGCARFENFGPCAEGRESERRIQSDERQCISCMDWNIKGLERELEVDEMGMEKLS